MNLQLIRCFRVYQSSRMDQANGSCIWPKPFITSLQVLYSLDTVEIVIPKMLFSGQHLICLEMLALQFLSMNDVYIISLSFSGAPDRPWHAAMRSGPG